jgi:hypothetical protein
MPVLRALLAQAPDRRRRQLPVSGQLVAHAAEPARPPRCFPRMSISNVQPLDDLSDEQLLMRLRVLTKQAAPLLARVAENDGASDGSPVSRTSTSTISATRF